ncbi:hypothetical protein KY358_05455 [Candidatus Woesearchaeota archaeon]|nr:hypothetical protein [Candidatus Woesearchaeota archaeon]
MRFLDMVMAWKENVEKLLSEKGRWALRIKYYDDVIKALDQAKARKVALSDMNLKNLKSGKIRLLQDESAYLKRLAGVINGMRVDSETIKNMEGWLVNIGNELKIYMEPAFAESIVKSTEARKLVNFKNVMEMIENQNNVVNSAWKSGNWSDFWSTFKNIEGIITDFKKAGFNDIAEYFERTEKKITHAKRSLVLWKNLFDQIYPPVKSGRYLQSAVWKFKKIMAEKIEEQQGVILEKVIEAMVLRKERIIRARERLKRTIEREMKPFESEIREFMIIQGVIAAGKEEKTALEREYRPYISAISRMVAGLRKESERDNWLSRVMKMAEERRPENVFTPKVIMQLVEQSNLARSEKEGMWDKILLVYRKAESIMRKMNYSVDKNNKLVEKMDSMTDVIMRIYKDIRPKVDTLLKRFEGMETEPVYA